MWFRGLMVLVRNNDIERDTGMTKAGVMKFAELGRRNCRLEFVAFWAEAEREVRLGRISSVEGVCEYVEREAAWEGLSF